MELPLCRFRGPAGEPGRIHCTSPVVRITGPVPVAVCRGCPAPDQASGRVALPPRPPCLYRGEASRPAAGEAEVFRCGRHGECSVSRPPPGVRACEGCPDYRPSEAAPDGAPSPETSVDVMTELLRGPPREWPDDWPFWATTQEAHSRLAAEFAGRLPPYPAGKYRGRGVVVLGGGAFFPGVYVVVRMIRHFGCTLPIEVWHQAEAEPIEEAWLRPYGVRCIDIDAHMDRVAPSRLRGGWINKMYSVLHSSFEEVLYLDSDCYPVADVTPLFDHNPHGAVFWPDFADNEHKCRWHIYGAQAADRRPIQGGQFLLDKRRCWEQIESAQWWNEHADYVYHHGYGDQDVLRGVWQRRGGSLTMFQDGPRYDRVAYVLNGPTGAAVLVHRCNDKFRLPLLELGCAEPTADRFYRHWGRTHEPTYQPGLPGEDLAFSFFNEFKQRYFDHDPGRFRPATDDALSWETVVHQNVHRLPERLAADGVVVDVGGRIGEFAHAACRRGAARVWVYEPDPERFALLRRNVAYWGDRVQARRLAVGAPSENPGGAEPISLDRVLADAGGEVRTLKLSCGGALWPILLTVRDLSMCRRVVGAYRGRIWEGRRRGPGDLCDILARHGFATRTEPLSDDDGLFWADRGEQTPRSR